eukprot:5558158-Prymnesium_polylepis.1
MGFAPRFAGSQTVDASSDTKDGQAAAQDQMLARVTTIVQTALTIAPTIFSLILALFGSFVVATILEQGGFGILPVAVASFMSAVGIVASSMLPRKKKSAQVQPLLGGLELRSEDLSYLAHTTHSAVLKDASLDREEEEHIKQMARWTHGVGGTMKQLFHHVWHFFQHNSFFPTMYHKKKKEEVTCAILMSDLCSYCFSWVTYIARLLSPRVIQVLIVAASLAQYAEIYYGLRPKLLDQAITITVATVGLLDVIATVPTSWVPECLSRSTGRAEAAVRAFVQ